MDLIYVKSRNTNNLIYILRPSFSIDAHKICVTDIDFNQNKSTIVVSSGKDCQIKIWDLRNPLKPLKQFSDHTHWYFYIFNL